MELLIQQSQSQLAIHKPFDRQLDTIKYLSRSQLESILNIAKRHSTRDYAMILTGYTHALRISEVSLLQLKWYEPATKRITIQRVKKGYKHQYQTSEECHKAISRWLKIRGELPGPLFVSRKTKIGGKVDPRLPDTIGISPRQISYIFETYAIEAGFPEDLQHFHTLRHTCAVHMVEKEIPMIQIKDWLGHKDINSTMIYAQVSDMSRNRTAEMFFEDETEGKKKKMEAREIKKKGVQWKKD